MKKLILAALLAVSGGVSAEEVMVANNDAGGSLVLTTRPCIIDGENRKHFRAAFTTAANGQAMSACWMPVGERIGVVYRDGESRYYKPSDFQVLNIKE